MTRGQTLVKSTRSGAIWASAGFLLPGVVFWFGLSQLPSLSGELPVYDPTDQERATWSTDPRRAIDGAGMATAATWFARAWSPSNQPSRDALGVSGADAGTVGNTTRKKAAIGPKMSVRTNQPRADRLRLRAKPPARSATVTQSEETTDDSDATSSMGRG
jgi:hypothetical protein